MLDIDKKFQEVLRKHDKDKCPDCQKVIDRGDVQWNNGSTGHGTGYSVLEIICERCMTEIVRVESWYPNIENFQEFVEVLEDELE